MQFNATEFDSRRLAQVRSTGTHPEMLLRKLLWQNGLRGYRKHPPLPGKPDLIFPRHKLAVFVDGCFWHGCPIHFKMPTNNADYWASKIDRNQKRDHLIRETLERINYRVLRLWEHEVKRDPASTLRKVVEATNSA